MMPIKHSLPKRTEQQPKASAASRKTAPVTQAKANSTGLPDTLKAGVENLSGYSMDNVKVHYNSAKPASLQAHAYAQGDAIHLAPGQERHLPHEAWHVVQQKQGRVKPTRQLKSGVPLNDTTGLEHEADRMGSKAAGFSAYAPGRAKKTTTETPNGTLQAYSIERDLGTGGTYSVSNDHSMVTGMNTPNHELYVDDAQKIEQITQAVGRGMIRFEGKGTQTLFGQNYHRVKPKFPKMRTESESFPYFDHRVNLDKTYYKLVEPVLKGDTDERSRELTQEIENSSWGERFEGLQTILVTLMKRLDLFKKLMLSHETFSEHPDEETMHGTLDFTALLEQGIYSQHATGEGMALILLQLKELAGNIRLGPLYEQGFIIDTMDSIVQSFENLLLVFPTDSNVEIDLLLVHSANYLAGVLQTIDENDPLFYRSCDVMSSMLTGNTVDETNLDQQKLFDTQVNRNMHYVTKLLASGGDWVSLESFATATGPEAEIAEKNAKDTSKLDHTWQYLMYGSLQREGSRLEPENQFFELYTRLRYMQRQFPNTGVVSNRFKERFTSSLKESDIQGLFGVTGFDEALHIKGLLVKGNLIDPYGEVLVSEHELGPEALKPVLGVEYEALAPELSQVLMRLLHTPRSQGRMIQDNDHNQVSHIEAWLKALGLPTMSTTLFREIDHLSSQGTEGSLSAFSKSLRYLLLTLAKGKKSKS